eukprot:5730598-Amphidinium_carterae.1
MQATDVPVEDTRCGLASRKCKLDKSQEEYCKQQVAGVHQVETEEVSAESRREESARNTAKAL